MQWITTQQQKSYTSNEYFASKNMKLISYSFMNICDKQIDLLKRLERG